MASAFEKVKGGRVSKKQTFKRIIKINSKNQIPPVVNAKKLFCRFKMDGCGHCVDSQADWDSVCKTVEGALNPECMIAEIETKLLPFFKMRDGFKPDGFPTHAFFNNGRYVETSEDRSVQGIMNSLNKNNFLNRNKKRKNGTRRRKTFKK